jgi:hypothetical protein
MNVKLKSMLIASAATVAVGFITTTAQADLITNGGFETGDFTGWIVNAVSYPMYIVTSPVQTGNYAAQIAGYDYGPDTLTQNNILTTAGQVYLLSFGRWQDVALPNGLTVTWNGNLIFSEADIVTGAPYQNFSFNVVGTGSDSLVFTAYNNPAFTYLDDVSVNPVPGPIAGAGLPGLLAACGGLLALVRRGRRKAA